MNHPVQFIKAVWEVQNDIWPLHFKEWLFEYQINEILCLLSNSKFISQQKIHSPDMYLVLCLLHLYLRWIEITKDYKISFILLHGFILQMFLWCAFKPYIIIHSLWTYLTLIDSVIYSMLSQSSGHTICTDTKN
jgi:hypothetical protein